MHFALKRFILRLDDTETESVNRPYHGLALHVKEYFHVQKVVKLHCQSCEFILVAMHSIQKGYFQVFISYKYPKSSQTDSKNDIRCYLRPVVDLTAKMFILGDFNIQIDCVNSEFVAFMESLFSCVQQVEQYTADSGSILDLIFVNCQALCDVMEAYWTDRKPI